MALGGGVSLDLGGFVASTYLRGVPWIALPTSLLAMVDASVGGKTAVNLSAGKNLAGTFHQPSAVYVDPETLSTLPAEEYRSGLGEVVKSGLIGDGEILVLLEENVSAVLERDADLLGKIGHASAIRALEAHADDPHPDVAEAVAAALSDIGARGCA